MSALLRMHEVLHPGQRGGQHQHEESQQTGAVGQGAACMSSIPDICCKPIGFAVWALKKRQFLPGFCLELYNTACV